MSDAGKDVCATCKDYDRCGENARPCEKPATCQHWFVPKKHLCGPPTEVCRDCGHERAT